jgi:hypothetical protein
MQLDKSLQTGGLNTDDTDYLLPKGDAENRVNVRVIETGSGDAGAVVNVLGNVLVESSEYNTNGIDTVIGSIEDPELRRVIFFVSNTGGNHKILCYKYDTNTVVRVLANENFGSGQKGLNFSKDFRINGVAMSGSLLYFTDNYNEPRRINVDELIPLVTGSSKVNNIKDTQIALIRPEPRLPLSVSKFIDNTLSVQFLDNDAFQFTYRYIYYNKEVSAPGPLSVLIAPNTKQEISDKYNAIGIEIPADEINYFNYKDTGGVNLYDVEKVQIIAKSLKTYKSEVIKTYDRETDTTAFNTSTFKFIFYNNTAGLAVPDSEAVKQFDNVPTKSKALEIAKNRLFLGNNTIGYDSPKKTSLTAGLSTPASPSEQISKYVKTDSGYQFGVVFTDFAGRKCGVVTNSGLIVNTPRRNAAFSTSSKDFLWTLSNTDAVNEIPSWATHYHIVRTHNLRTRYFIQGKSADIRYVQRDDKGDFTNPVTSFSSTSEALRIDISDLFRYGIGYSFNSGDLIKLFWSADSTDKYVEVRIDSVVGKYIYASLAKLGNSFGTTTNISYSFEIYTPYEKSAQEVYFEVGASGSIKFPNTANRIYGQLNGTITGDVWVGQRATIQNTSTVKFDGNIVINTVGNTKEYELEGWEKMSSSTRVNFYKTFNGALETERYVKLYRPVDGDNGLKSLSTLNVSAGDSFSMSIDAKGDYNTNWESRHNYDVKLEATDGTTYWLKGQISATPIFTWTASPTKDADTVGYIWQGLSGGAGSDRWKTHTIKSQPVPKAGVIKVYIRGWVRIKNNWFAHELLDGTGLYKNINILSSPAVSTDLYAELMSPTDTLWQTWFTDCGRANLIIEKGQAIKPSSIVYSNTIIEGSSINGLSAFEALNETIIDGDAGGIMKLIYTSKGDQYGNVMLALCTSDAMSLYLGESRIVDNAGDGFLAASPGIIGTVYPLKGNLGTMHPESTVEVAGKVYWFCIHNGCVVRYDNQGLEVISDQKMRNFFQKRSKNLLESNKYNLNVIAGFDLMNDEYVINIPEYLNDEVPKFEDVIRDAATESFVGGVQTIVGSITHGGVVNNSITALSTNKLACTSIPADPIYHTAPLGVGTSIFTDTNLVNYSGATGWYKTSNAAIYVEKSVTTNASNVATSSVGKILEYVDCADCFDCRAITISDANLYNSGTNHYVDVLLGSSAGYTGKMQFQIYNIAGTVLSTKIVNVVPNTLSISFSNTNVITGTTNTIKARVYHDDAASQPCTFGTAKTVDYFDCTTIVATNNSTTLNGIIGFKNCTDNTELIYDELGSGVSFEFCSKNGEYSIKSFSPSTNISFVVVSYCNSGITCNAPVITSVTPTPVNNVSLTFTAASPSATSFFFIEASTNQTTWNGYKKVYAGGTYSFTLPSTGLWYFRVSNYCDGRFIKYSNILSTTTLACNAAVTISATAPSNAAANNGSAIANPTSGTAPYTYLWSNGQTTQTATGLSSAATYSVTITDANSCTATASTTIAATTFTCNITATMTSVNPTNQAGTNGTATATPSGGTAPYTYLWSNTQTTQTATGLSSGVSYSVTITDANNCTVTKSISVGQTNFTFDADYMVITYQFTDGLDLDTRTRIVSIDGTTYAPQNDTPYRNYIGWGKEYRAPYTANYNGQGSICAVTAPKPISSFGGDNTGTGFESVVIDFSQLSEGQNEIKIDCRAFWFNTLGTNPVNIAFTLYKGGCPSIYGIVNTTPPDPLSGTISNPTATATFAGTSSSKVITAVQTGSPALVTGSSDLESPAVTASLTRGQRLAVITYNRSTNVGTLDTNDTTTLYV